MIGPEHLGDGILGRVRRLRTKVGYLKLHAALRERPDFSRHLGSGYDPKTITRV